MKVCVISPASHLNDFSTLGDCEMALTHLLVPNAGFEHTKPVQENYASYFKQRSEEGKWVILDNSAYEIGKLEATKATGEGLGPSLVLQAADIIKPSIVIAQDILCDRDATLEATKDFISYVKKNKMEGNFQLMAVAQGKTKDEWLESFCDLWELYHDRQIHQIGLSKISVPISFGGNQAEDGCVAKARLECTAAINDNLNWYMYKSRSRSPDKEIPPLHLLGGDNYLPWELSQQSRYDWIFSNDSSATVWYGAKGKIFDSTGKIENIITEKPDLENHQEETTALLDNNRSTILRNIALLHRFSKGVDL